MEKTQIIVMRRKATKRDAITNSNQFELNAFTIDTTTESEWVRWARGRKRHNELNHISSTVCVLIINTFPSTPRLSAYSAPDPRSLAYEQKSNKIIIHIEPHWSCLSGLRIKCKNYLFRIYIWSSALRLRRLFHSSGFVHILFVHICEWKM